MAPYFSQFGKFTWSFQSSTVPSYFSRPSQLFIMNPTGPIFVPIQVGYCKVYLHTVGLTPGFTYLVSLDDAGVGFASPVMVCRVPVARLTIESPLGIVQLLGLRVFYPSAPTFGPAVSETRWAWAPVATPQPVLPALLEAAPGLNWSWSSPSVESPVGILISFQSFQSNVFNPRSTLFILELFSVIYFAVSPF